MRWFVLLAMVGCTPQEDDFSAWVGEDVQAGAAPALLHLWVDPLVRGRDTTITVTGAVPGATVQVAGSLNGPGVGPCYGQVCFDVVAPKRLGGAVADAAGVAVVTLAVPPNLNAAAASLQAVSFGGAPAASQVVTTEVIDLGEDAVRLLAGANTVNTGGALPSSLALWHERAFPLLVDAQGRTLLAGARVNAGKLLLAGHESLLLSDLGARADDLDVVLVNALRWMGGLSPVIGVPSGYNTLRTFLTNRGFTVVTASPSQLAGVDVWMSDTYTDLSPSDDAAIRAFLEAGGGVVAGGHAWWWANTHDEGAAEHYPGNHWLRDAGVLITTGTTGQGSFSLTPPDRLYGGGAGLQALLDDATGGPSLTLDQERRAADGLVAVANVLPLTFVGFWDLADAFLQAHGPVVPTTANPVDRQNEPVDRAWITLRHGFDGQAPANEVTAHPAAADFPGAPAPNAPRVQVDVLVNADHAGRDARYSYAGALADAWRSTGAWAPAGEVVTVTVPPALVGQGVQIRIGAHSDGLWDKSAWERVPTVSRVWSVDAAVTEVASAHGGLIYVVIPTGAVLGDHVVTLDGVVRAPTFVRGQTSPVDWAAERQHGAPWGEIITDGVILTLPRANLVGLADPAPLADYWQQVADAQADLAGIPRDRPRAERLVIDRQISAGWMHAGYPIMAHLASAPDWTNLAHLQAAGDWGAFHELGHNHQWRDWLLPGTTEATCNLWSTYTMETVVGLAPRTGHPALDPADRAQRIVDYLNGGPDFWADWSVWTALETHLQLQEAFGWAWWVDLVSDYNDDPTQGAPADDQARIDLFVQRASEHAGVDLGPFFVAWGFPVSPGVLVQVAALPPWANDPMNP